MGGERSKEKVGGGRWRERVEEERVRMWEKRGRGRVWERRGWGEGGKGCRKGWKFKTKMERENGRRKVGGER